MSAAGSVPRQDPAIGRAIAFALASYIAFSTSDALIKLATGGYSVFQIAVTVALAALFPVLFLTRGRGGLRGLVPKRPRLVLLRGLLTGTGGLCIWNAFALMPLADGYAILFASPMLVTAFSRLILKEPIGWRRWSAAVLGFVGVLVMIDPDFQTLGVGHALAALAAVLGSLSFIVLKTIGARETSASILFVLFVSIATMSLPGAFLNFRPPTPGDLGLMIVAGLLMGMGQAVLVLATRTAPASVVAPFQYTQMVWAVVLGLMLFGDTPQTSLFVGMALVVASGLYTLWRETVRRQLPHLGAPHGEVPARAARGAPEA
jgi:drug/metabolite transporter (DMT)-like permease